MDRKDYQKLILLCCLLLSACRKDKPESTSSGLPGSSGNVYITCEGNFGSYQASLYAYDLHKDSVFGDLYQTVNKTALGDIVQSMQRIDNQYFLCVNNSDKLVVLNAADWKQTAVIPIKKPRYMLAISSTKAFVSSEYNNKVYVINPQTLAVTDTITFPFTNTEGMCMSNGFAFVCCWDTQCNRLYKINIATNKVIQEITLPGYAPQDVLIDKEQLLWVLSGNQPYNCNAYLTRIDPSSGNVLNSYKFPAKASPLKLTFNATKDTLYFLEAYNGGGLTDGVYRMDIHSGQLPQTAFIEEHTNQYFWALGVNPENDDIYVADAKDFSQKGTVYVMSAGGKQKTSFNVGPGPGHFYFDR